MQIVLIGFMGSGKTSLGKKLASKLKYKFIDLDHAIEKTANKTIPQLFEQNGENYFRELEQSELINQLQSDNIVLACGGGTPCFFDNIEIINKSAISIYLKATPLALQSRLQKNKNSRPLIKDLDNTQLLNFIETKLTEREVFYLKSKLQISALNVNVPELVLEIKKEFT